MRAVIDTNVVAHLLLGTEAFVDESRACFEHVGTPLAPAHWEAELTNVVWMAGTSGHSVVCRGARASWIGAAAWHRVDRDHHAVPGSPVAGHRVRGAGVRHTLRRTGRAV